MGYASGPRVGLFVTCLIDVLRPSVGFATAQLLEDAGCSVEVPRSQTCCGQPAYNSGDKAHARAFARATLKAFAGFDYVVVPSGSCAAMLKLHVAGLLGGDEEQQREARALADRTYELTTFLVTVRKILDVRGTYKGRVAYHDGCSGLRELGVRSAPRKLLNSIAGLELCELPDDAACCGFGGLFAVKYPDISNAMTQKKCQAIEAVAPSLVVAGDLGCLWNIAGKLIHRRSTVACRHVAEVLAGDVETPPIGQRHVA